MRWSESAAGSSTQPRSSALGSLLLEKWCWGGVSAPFLQQVSAAAIRDGAVGEDINILGGLGSSGLYPGNMHAELTKKLKRTDLDQITCDTPSFMNKHLSKVTQVMHPMLLPHILFSALFNH